MHARNAISTRPVGSTRDGSGWKVSVMSAGKWRASEGSNHDECVSPIYLAEVRTSPLRSAVGRGSEGESTRQHNSCVDEVCSKRDLRAERCDHPPSVEPAGQIIVRVRNRRFVEQIDRSLRAESVAAGDGDMPESEQAHARRLTSMESLDVGHRSTPSWGGRSARPLAEPTPRPP